MTLLIDIGNTRIKWNLREDLDRREQFALPHSGWTKKEVTHHLLQSIPRPAQVFVANVGGTRIGETVADAIRAEWAINPTFVAATANAGGVSNAYKVPEKLGVDRWLCIIAAYQLVKTAACVVSLGTATTADCVDSDGRHLGGVIVPGPQLMTSSLLTSTSDIAARTVDGEVQLEIFADNTLGAIEQGAKHATAALIERVYHDLHSRLGVAPQLILCGGALTRVRDSLRVPYSVTPDLVLRGLAVISRELESKAKLG